MDIALPLDSHWSFIIISLRRIWIDESIANIHEYSLWTYRPIYV